MLIQGASEGDVGFDGGPRLAAAISANALIFARYDGRFRDVYHAHAFASGVKVRW
jgi:hypothetical protein